MTTAPVASSKPRHRIDRVVIRFAGDSGDGMQLTGDRFTAETASLGNDLATLPNFPAEIRAPQGTLPGVSSFQLHFADHEVLTPGDAPDVLVAMNPAALKANLRDLPRGATIVLDTDEFTKRNLTKVGYAADPRDDGTLDSYHVHALPLTAMTVQALAEFDLTRKEAERAKNMFALGMLSWLYSRPTEPTRRFLEQKFGAKPQLLAANLKAFEAGWSYGETTEDFAVQYEVAPAPAPSGVYRNVTGNIALAYGLVAAAHRAGLPLVLGSYPITPASDILHTLSRMKRFGVTTLQAEDEIAAIGMALGAAYGGAVAVTATSGPGLALKSETIGLAVSLELPLVVVDVQRGGPSTGLPTKTEQADLLQAMFGRNGEAPVPIVAPRSPADCFEAALEAVRIATTYRTPVLLLSDGYLANGSEPWLIPDVASLPDLGVEFATPSGDGPFRPYDRDPPPSPGRGRRPASPGSSTASAASRRPTAPARSPTTRTTTTTWSGCARRRSTVSTSRRSRSTTRPETPNCSSSAGARPTGRSRPPRAPSARAGCRRDRASASLNPFPANTGEVLRRYRRVLVPEMNLGQLAMLLRARYLVDAVGYNRVRGVPFTSAELADAIRKLAEEDQK